MDSYSDLFEKVNESETPEDSLVLKIEEEIWELLTALKGQYWFHEDIIYSESDVLDWLREYRSEFYAKAFVELETVEGSDVITDALKALGLMKEWHEVEEQDIRTPEDEERWKAAIKNHD